jgi:hypothetical protein
LDAGLRYEEIADSIVSEAKVLEKPTVIPYRDARSPAARRARQVVFQVWVSRKNCDLFFNAPDGLRGRYWQSPDLGFLATRRLIEALKQILVQAARDSGMCDRSAHAGNITLGQVGASLEAFSAKVWLREKDARGSISISSPAGLQLNVPRWVENEPSGGKNRLWRWTPDDRNLEIKSALLDPDGVEYIPEGKRDRSCQIHLYGFS